MSDRLESRAIISGAGISEIGRRLGRTGLDLALDAALEAIGDAGLRVEDIDGIASMGDAHPDQMRDNLGVELEWMGACGTHRSGQLGYLLDACMAVATGLCRHVLVYRSVSMMPGEFGAEPATWAFSVPYYEFAGTTLVARYAMRHMHEYGTTREQLGAIALATRRHAMGNARAALRTPLTMDDYLSARWIAEPLCLLDCDVPVDGAVAVIVSDAGHAAGCPRPPVRFAAVGCAVGGHGSYDYREDYPSMGGTRAAAQMWRRTDLRPADVDVAQLYDGFSFLALSWLEALGFCEVGEGGPFVEGGHRIGPGGDLPLNTYGGQLSAGRVHGYWLLHEAVAQLRGDAGARQVRGAEVAVISAGAGHRQGCMLLTR